MPKTSEAKLRAIRKYDAANTKQFNLKLNLNTDADILRRLSEVSTRPGGVQGYIKSLIRADTDLPTIEVGK